MVKVERVEVREDFPNRDEAYAILRGADGRYAFAWGPKYPYAEELPSENIPVGESGFEWYDSEDSARAAMNDAISAWDDIRGKPIPPLGGYQAVADILGTTRAAIYGRWQRMRRPAKTKHQRGDLPWPATIAPSGPLWNLDEIHEYARQKKLGIYREKDQG